MNHIIKEFTETQIKDIIASSNRVVDCLYKFGYKESGQARMLLKDVISFYNLDISHFNKRGESNRKYDIITKTCPVCTNTFTTKSDTREKMTCSRSCSNTYYRSGEQNPNWKENTYRSTCFLYHSKECIICKESNIVEVHHLDNNHNNNNPCNLMPLCPTHHQYWHSSFRHLVIDSIVEYSSKFSDTYNSR